MARFFYLVSLMLLFHFEINAQNKNETISFPLVFKFESICCGVPSDKPLNDYLKNFKQKNNINAIHASYIGPMGREGEYHIGFPLTEMNNKQKASFIKGLKNIASKMRDKGQAVVEQNFSLNKSDLSESTTLKEIDY